MQSFEYIARDFTGEKKVGLKQALSELDVLTWLREQGFTPVLVKKIGADTKKKTQGRRKRIKSADLSAIFWQLTTMVEAGIPITTSLETIAGDIENLSLQNILKQILERMEKGETFTDSISGFPKVFNPLCRAIILAGETSGTISESLRRLAEYFETRDKLVKKVRSAMAYPCFVLGFIIVLLTFIMAFIIPRFKLIFDQIGSRLPAFTRAFMAFYDNLCSNLVYIIGFGVVAVIAGVYYGRTKNGHLLYSKIAIGAPLVGKVVSQAFVATFCRTMATLLGAGVSVLEVMDILAQMTHNDIMKTAVTMAREHIVQGSTASSAIASSGFFPNLVIKMVQVGEESGTMAGVLNKTADYYERKVDATITTMMALLEPILIVSVGAIVLTVVLALYLPIFTMSDIRQ